jgi:hypothetical protein
MTQNGGNNTMIFLTAMISGLGIIVLTLYLSGALDMFMSV